MLKTTALTAWARPGRTKTNKNELDIDDGSGIGGDKINDRIAKSTKVKKSSDTSFLTSEANLAFI